MKKQEQERSTDGANKFIIELSIDEEGDAEFGVDIHVTAASPAQAGSAAQKTLWLLGAGLLDFLKDEHDQAVERGRLVLEEMYKEASKYNKKPRKAKKNG